MHRKVALATIPALCIGLLALPARGGGAVSVRAVLMEYDARYNTSLNSQAPNNYSPVAINIRTAPSASVNATVGAEIDSHYRKLRQLSANASYSWIFSGA